MGNSPPPTNNPPTTVKMSQSHALSDDQVGQELKKMTAFIKQEAMEKGREIEIKADEEFAIKTRLKGLSARQELLDAIFEAAQKKLGDQTKDKGKYQTVLKGLLLEGLYALNEEKLVVRARKADKDVVGKAIKDAEKEYKE